MRHPLILLAVSGLVASFGCAAEAQPRDPGTTPPMASPQNPAEQPAGTTGKVNRVDPQQRVINLTHGPIAALGWPGMTMDFGVAPSVDLTGVKPGDTVAFTVGKDAKGIYRIDSLTAAK